MNHDNYPHGYTQDWLAKVKSIAVVGASPNAARPSFGGHASQLISPPRLSARLRADELPRPRTAIKHATRDLQQFDPPFAVARRSRAVGYRGAAAQPRHANGPQAASHHAVVQVIIRAVARRLAIFGTGSDLKHLPSRG